MKDNLQGIKMRYGIIGKSPLLDRALGTAIRVAPTDLTVLITGESGVGKEVFSKIIHSQSTRKHNNFIAINCGAIPPGTINSELFGHEKGAFTGATADRKGYFETVDNGTIFLDEIGDLPLDTQAFLLRILESGEFIRVGSSKVLHTNVRIVAATNVDLMAKVKKGKFREDLYYRLNTVPIKLPSLKERVEDIPVLFRKFSSDFAEKYRTRTIRLDDRAVLLIQAYSWPGNIRELKNMAEQLSVMAEEDSITAESLVDHFPHLLQRNLPAIRDAAGQEDNFKEREILYKLLFEMKADLNDLKNLVFELINSNDLDVPDLSNLKSLTTPEPITRGMDEFQHRRDSATSISSEESRHELSKPIPIIIDKLPTKKNEMVEAIESLSLEDMEKDLIRKALVKHKGRRKEAAKDLGISERTLYRKIKQYELET